MKEKAGIYRTDTPKIKVLFAVTAVFLFVLISLFTFFCQTTIDYINCPIFDGYKYLQISNWLQNPVQWPPIKFPFSTRVGYPFLVNLVSTDIYHGYFICNTICHALIFIGLLFIVFKNNSNSIYQWLLIIWTIFHWMGPIRQQTLDPIALDSPTWLGLAIIAICVHYEKWLYAAITIILFSFIKELFLAIGLTLFIWAFLFHKDRKIQTILSITVVLSFVILAFLKQTFPPINGTGRNSIITLAYHLKEILIHPQKILFWIAAFFSALGFWWIPFAAQFKIRQIQQPLVFLLGSLLILSALGGDDYTRLIMMTLPILLIIFQNIEINTKTALAIFITSIPFCRLDQCILPNPSQHWDQYAALFPEYSGFVITSILLGYGVLVTCLMSFMLVKRNL